MAIITISRGSYSRGKEVAELVAEELGYKCVSREVLLEASSSYDVPEIKLVRSIHDAPTILERLNKSKKHFVNYIKAALLARVKSGDVVYHGLAGHFLLAGLSHVLKVRIVASMDTRAKEEMKREGISLGEAMTLLRRDDDERRKWGLSLYGADSWDPRLYDMTLCVDTLTVQEVAKTIADTARLPSFQPTDESRRALADCYIKSQIEASLQDSFSNITSVSVQDGCVLVSATANFSASSQTSQEISRLIRTVEGVKEAHVEVTPLG